MNNKLTQKQEKFTLNLFDGMTQREAWIQAGYSSKYDIALVDIHACALANSDRVKIRLQELNDAAASPRVMSKGKRLERLSEIANTSYREPTTAKESILAIAEMNKMGGDYAPERHAVLGDILVEVVYKEGKNKELPGATKDDAL